MTGLCGVFIGGSRGRLLVVRHTPPSDTSVRGAIICIPPFADELNRSRHMLAGQAREFARQGYEVLLPDLAGCGDSEGDFEDATWTLWLDDLLRIWRWLSDRIRGPVSLWGVRAGALLLADLIRRDGLQPEYVILWQPCTRGGAVLDEFLRVVPTAQLLEGRAERTTLNEMRGRLEAGDVLDIGGYRLNSELAAALAKSNLISPLRVRSQVGWIEVSSAPDKVLTGPSQSVTEAWRSAGISVYTVIVSGPRFWSTTEISQCPAIVEVTSRWLRACKV